MALSSRPASPGDSASDKAPPARLPVEAVAAPSPRRDKPRAKAEPPAAATSKAPAPVVEDEALQQILEGDEALDVSPDSLGVDEASIEADLEMGEDGDDASTSEPRSRSSAQRAAKAAQHAAKSGQRVSPRPRSSNAPPEGEFERLFAQWRATGDPDLRDRLILMHRNLVTYLARRFTDRGEMYEDIIQQGLIGLINALDHFDPARGVRFATFATPTIVGEIRRYFRDKTWSVRVPRRLQELHQTINKRIEALTQELNRSPTYGEIAMALGVEEEDVVEAMEMSHALDPTSLDEPGSNDENGAGPIAEQVGGEDLNLERINDFSQLQSALNLLPERQRRVLQLAYFDQLSQAEIAKEIKVSPMHVSRLQRRALNDLKEILENMEDAERRRQTRNRK